MPGSGSLTQDCHDHPVLQDLHGPVGEVVDAVEGVTPMDQELVRSAEVRLDLERDKLPASLRRGLENGKAEDFSVKVEGNVATEFFRVVLQYLQANVRLPQVEGSNPVLAKDFSFKVYFMLLG